MQNLSLSQKVHQMFILGYEGTNPLSAQDFTSALMSGLGGVIFFTRNIVENEQFKSAVKTINDIALIKPFLSIDQEGGRVERTLNIYGKPHYLSARMAARKGEDFVEQQTQWISQELNYYGLNMNFAPVLDVDTNPNNPIIAERAFSSDADEVSRFGRISINTYKKNGIIPVAKHFPGHGDTSIDSHIDMPIMSASLKEMENVHIKPFRELINDIPAVMVAHIHYNAFDVEKIPASISTNVIKYLREQLGFNGVVMTDDMVMGSIKKFATPLEACKKAINAGVNMFIYRNADFSTTELIASIVKSVECGEISECKIDESVSKILSLKQNVAKS